LIILATFVVAACAVTPDMADRDPAAGGAGVSAKIGDYNKTVDGSTTFDAGSPVDVPVVVDSGTPPPKDAGDKPPVDAGPIKDTNKPPVDAGPDITKDAGPTWPPGKLQVLSAFSPDGKNVKVRFNKPPEAKGSAKTSNFTISSSTGDKIAVLSSKLDINPVMVALTLDPKAKINPQVTYTVLVKSLKAADGQGLDSGKRKAVIKRTVYLHLMFHQHQPTYEDPLKDELQSPWVRKHATKDYYDMASVLEPYPKVHLTMNLTAVLLKQLQHFYVERMKPYVDTKKNTVDAKAFLAAWKGKTDPWIDLLLEPTPTPKAASEKQIGLLYADPWSCVSTSPVLMKRFPAYAALRDKNPATLTQKDYLGLKIWFELAWMDPDFLHGPVKLATGDVVDMTDIIAAKPGGIFELKVPLSEALANRIVAEEYKIMAAVVPIHKQMAYDPDKYTGQIELSTTPFYHPILPLIHDTDLMSQGQPWDPKPPKRFNYPKDASAQVGRAVAYFEDLFGIKPRGMWPGEGSVAEEVVQHFVEHGVVWVATDQQVMNKSGGAPGGAPVRPFLVDADTKKGSDGSNKDELAVYFRNTQQSNDMGFKYQSLTGEQSSSDLVKNVVAQAPSFGAEDRVITLILDGENAWETFSKEHDGKGFFHKLYTKLSAAYDAGEIITVTGSEYLLGNPSRNVPAHQISKLPELEPLFPGSWIGGNFSIWIGEGEENAAWAYLHTARADLAKSGLKQPDPKTLLPTKKNTVEYETWRAFDEMYGAEGSDWFWWYGADMTSPSNNDSPFDLAFRTHLAGMYQHMNAALKLQGKAEIPMPVFKPLIQAAEQLPQGPLVPAPKLDGKFSPNETEWSAKGGFFFDSDTADAQANPDDWIAAVYYGTDAKGLYLGVQHNFDLSGLNGSALLVYLSQKHITNPKTGTFKQDPFYSKTRTGADLAMKAGGASRELSVWMQGGKSKAELRVSDGKSNWPKLAKKTFTGAVGGPVKGGKLIEILLPWADLGMSDGDPVEVRLGFLHVGKLADTAPSLEAKQLIEDATNAVFCTFEVDARGASGPHGIKLDLWNKIDTWPPPNGKGVVYIAGNHPKLGMKTKWVPNKIAMRDDGKEGDKKAGDGIWTRVFDLSRGTTLKYKYTIGLPKDEGKWAGTEEFPLTERGLNVTKNPTKTKMTISDVFADRPEQSGQAAPKTVIKEL